MRRTEIISVIELDMRNVTYQSGVARYMDILAAQMPPHIKTFRIIFYYGPEIKNVRMETSENELGVYIPNGFPANTLYAAIIAFIGAQINQMPNLIVKSNCLGVEDLAYMIRSRFYCRLIGVLHCLPHRAYNSRPIAPINPFFNMDHVVLVCDHGCEYLELVKNTRPASVIYNGIETPKIIGTTKRKDKVFRFIFANGWAPHKGLQRIIPAIRNVSQKHKIEVVVIGGHENGMDIGEQISDLPIINVGLLDNSDDIRQYYESADCALFASYSEACSFAGIEAMAYNLPIISSDAAGLTEMFGRAALYAPSDDKRVLDADKYAENMLRIIENSVLRLRMGALSYARYRERYTARKMARATIELYKKLLWN